MREVLWEFVNEADWCKMGERWQLWADFAASIHDLNSKILHVQLNLTYPDTCSQAYCPDY